MITPEKHVLEVKKHNLNYVKLYVCKQCVSNPSNCAFFEFKQHFMNIYSSKIIQNSYLKKVLIQESHHDFSN